jgi:hypothetical protein
VIRYTFWLDHYLTILGVQDDKILAGDPSLGLVTLSRTEFLARWRFVGVVLKRKGVNRGRLISKFGGLLTRAALRSCRGRKDQFLIPYSKLDLPDNGGLWALESNRQESPFLRLADRDWVSPGGGRWLCI